MDKKSVLVGKIVNATSFLNFVVVTVTPWHNGTTKVTATDQRRNRATCCVEFFVKAGETTPVVGQRISGQAILTNVDEGIRHYYKSGYERDEDHLLTYKLENVTWA